MPIKNTLRKSARPLLAVLLLVGGSLILPQGAFAQQDTAPIVFPPEIIQAWKDYMKHYPVALAQYRKEQAAIEQAAKPVTPSDVQDIDKLVKAYPFLQKDMEEVKEIQKKAADSGKNPDPDLKQLTDTTPHIQVGEDKDKKGGINVLFIAKSGHPWCSGHGCNLDVYIDTGTGYQKAGSFIVARDLYLSRMGGNVFLFAGRPGDPATVVWILKNNRFITMRPPSAEPPSQAFLEWKTQLQKAGKWPPQ